MNKLFFILISFALPMIGCEQELRIVMKIDPSVDANPVWAYTQACILPGSMHVIRYLENNPTHAVQVTTQQNLDHCLGYAVSQSHYAAVAHLLHKGANPNARCHITGRTTLHAASADGNAKLVTWLRIFGADPSIEGMENQDAGGSETPLETAQARIESRKYNVFGRYGEVIRLLKLPASDFEGRKDEVRA